jgi:hypothetical protein
MEAASSGAHRAADFLDSFLSPITRETRRAYKKSSDAVHGAMDSVKDIDVEDYTDPVVSWVSRLWKKCCG